MEKALSLLEKQLWGIVAPAEESSTGSLSMAGLLETTWRTSNPRQKFHRFSSPTELTRRSSDLLACDFLAVVVHAGSAELLETLQDIALPWDRVIVLCEEETPLLMTGKTEDASFLRFSTSTPPEEILQALAAHAQRHLTELHDREVAQARASGMLRLLVFLTGGSLSDTFERARISCSLAQFHTEDPNVIRRTVRLALYRELPEVPGWKDAANPAAGSVEALLEQAHALLHDQPWPAATPIEVVLAETARLACAHTRGSEKDFRESLKRMSSLLPFSLRTSVRNAADRVLRTLWEHKYDVA